MIQISDILFDLCGCLFLEPYLRRELTPDYDPELPATALPAPRKAIRIVHLNAPSSPDSTLEEACSSHGLPLLTLLCPNIIATGMNGLMHRIAAGIYSGTYFHISEAQGKASVIHATDVAVAAALAAGRHGEFTLTDRREHSIYDIAEALAYRIDNKRLFTLPGWLCRWWYGREYFSTLTSDASVASDFAEICPDFSPVDTLLYLHTHTYDDASL